MASKASASMLAARSWVESCPLRGSLLQLKKALVVVGVVVIIMIMMLAMSMTIVVFVLVMQI